MPVRFRGLSEYQRNFLWKKSYLSESCNPSVGRKYPWAGLRSDQLGITKEPGFISKRRVPYHDAQISKSLKWNGPLSENGVVISPEPEAPETPKSEAQQEEDVHQGKVLSLEASRVPERSRSHSADSRAAGASGAVEKKEDVATDHTLVNETVEQEHSTNLLSETVDNGLDRALRKKAGLTVVPAHSALRNSEYQRQFVWKTCKETAPGVAANQVFHNKSKFVPQFKGNPIIHETEYKRNFKGLSPVKEPKLRRDLKENGSLETLPPEKVKELREKAEFYRKRVQGTHFSRDHLNQILSDKNCCWDVSSTTSSERSISSNIKALDLAGDPTSHKTLQKCPPPKLEEKRDTLEVQPQKGTAETLGVSETPALPVRRRLAWDAEDTSEDLQKQHRAEREEEEEGRAGNEQVHAGELEERDTRGNSQADETTEGSESSAPSGKGGRLPTPKLRELGGVQRTHHDLTTPAVGGAVLVSPSKVKPAVSERRRKTSSQDGTGTPKNSTKKGSRAVSLLTSPAAGIKTVDPLPLREDSEGNIPRFIETTLPVSRIPEYPTNPQGEPPSPLCTPPFWHPSRRIQGSLRDPEFQHNVGKARMNNFQLPQREAFNNEDEDRLSEISARSAASSVRAFQTLTRAQKRKENFWGKM
ncbi:PREDICTED: nuclear protein MDM1 isoform X5 [Chinchilla lanigera]|uniref:nuclear protein MDM1 isoform X5 n=1 Tax=Chinchilla lanigera TaxID=34839 RepID=UPI000697C9B2|nr:PREDICTED: nuclear protein MDM1 isoform X5 [Chinchilla lanigera]